MHSGDICVKALVFFAQGSSALNVNATNDFGDTALHLATKWGYLSLVRFLLDNGASVLVKNRKHHDALRYSHTSQMSEAISRAAVEQAQAVTFHRQMSMRKTISMNDFNPPKVEIAPSLDTSGRVHDLTRSLSVVPSQLASARKVTRAGSMGSILGEQSLSHSSRRRSSDASDKGRSLVNKKVDKLLKAVTDGDINMARFHLGWSSDSEDEEEDSCDLDLSDRELCHPLCQCDQCQPLQKLTSPPATCSVHVNSRDGSGHTPLHAAAHGGHPALVALFLRRGANVNSRTLGTESSPLHLACKQRDVEVMKILLSHGADVNAQDCDGNSPLHHCCMMGSDKKVALLIQHKADVGLANQKGDSPLHAAVRWNSRAVVRLLLAHGAPPEGRNRDGKLPLHYSQTEEMCNLLRQAMSTARITREAHTSNRTFSGHGSAPSRYVPASDASRTASESPTSSTLTSSGRSDTSSAETVRPVTSAAESSPELTEEESPAPRRATAKSPTSSENYCTVDGNLVSVVIPPDDAIAAMKRASFGESFGDGLTIVDDYFEVEPLSNSSSVYVTRSIDQADQRDSDCCSENSNTESQQDLSIA